MSAQTDDEILERTLRWLQLENVGPTYEAVANFLVEHGLPSWSFAQLWSRLDHQELSFVLGIDPRSARRRLATGARGAEAIVCFHIAVGIQIVASVIKDLDRAVHLFKSGLPLRIAAAGSFETITALATSIRESQWAAISADIM